ncbi:ABC transporter substrate-binding protein [Desertimonas flava]|jgi:NitT/TauT family transport system substrate-binding protein|uniref:ABC transporter substrate-binding protein n=1 Tax=Desertimonas flava TaxID=2064846 RepID=UPI000E350FDC|nr:ABC transporter substrate-binding protein [Desertimonas flava]
MKHRMKLLGAGVVALPLVAGAATAFAATEPPTTESAATESAGSAAPAECESVDSVTLQLQWFFQGQFAGYMAARDNGIYEQYCLDVEILEGGVDIVPQQVLADGGADFAIAWVPKALATREAGADIVNIAQIFQRSGTLQVSFADAGITTPEDFEGKNIGNWGFGNEYEIFAALAQAGLDPASDVNLVQQQFDMVGLLDRSIDAAEAMTYNEYAQALEAVNPDTGELYQPEDFNVISYEEVGVGMLQDAIWADGARLADDEAYVDIATRFVAASIEGWAWARDNVEDAAALVVDGGSQLGASHQLWQVNEVNKLIWPAENGIGYIDEAAWTRTVDLALNTPNLEGTTVLTAEPTDGAYTNDIVTAAHELLGDSVDINGADFAPIEVTLNEGGE